MVLAVARLFVAAVAAEGSLRMALGRFLSLPFPRPPQPPRDESRAEKREGMGGMEEDSEWLWGESGVFEGPLREAILAGLQGSDSVVVVEGGGSACACAQALIRPEDLSEALLSDDEVFLIFGKHFADARQIADMAPWLRSALGLHELEAPAVVQALRQLQEMRGAQKRSEQLACRGSVFFDQLFSYLWRHRVALGIGNGSAAGAEGGAGGAGGGGGVDGRVSGVGRDLLSLHMIPMVSVRHGYTLVDPLEGRDGCWGGRKSQV